MADARLPQVGGDDGNWGQLLNEFLEVAHQTNGLLKPIDQATVSGLAAALTAKADAGTVTALQSQVAALPKITVATTAPTSPAVNDIWVDIS